ncbi:MAG: hypothetical protein ACK4ME_04050 [Fimbriimonadales bacterium]
MRLLSLLMSLVFVLNASSQKFPRLCEDQSLLERAQTMQLFLSEARQAFEHTLAHSQDPRQIALHSRVLFLSVLMLRNDLASRYHQRADAPVSPPISESESRHLLRFIQELMNLEAALLALEETALRETAKQYPQLEKDRAVAQWLQHNQNMRRRLMTQSSRTGLSIRAFPRVRWEARQRIIEHVARTLQGCEYKPAQLTEKGELVHEEIIKLPQGLERFALHPLPWRKEEGGG